MIRTGSEPEPGPEPVTLESAGAPRLYEQAERTRHHLLDAMRTLIDAKRADLGEDLTSLLLTAHEDDGDRLSESELVSTLILMIGAGSETTVALPDHAVRELLAHPGQLAVLRNDPSRWPDAVEETLRLHSPLIHLPCTS